MIQRGPQPNLPAGAFHSGSWTGNIEASACRSSDQLIGNLLELLRSTSTACTLLSSLLGSFLVNDWSMTGQLVNEHGTPKIGNFVSHLSHLVFQSLPASMPAYLKTPIDKRLQFSLHVLNSKILMVCQSYARQTKTLRLGPIDF